LNNSGAVTLPTLKANTLTGYDVKNKTATFDNNAHFDANGIFSRWPVDQGVIGQLADAINAKLPIEEGPANTDLLMNAGNKIVYWHGNGDAVKNLPPMNNKKYFFLFNSGIFLASVGKFGSATFDAIYVVLYILHIVLYFFIKRYLWIKSKVFINIMIQIDVKLEARLINRKRDMN